MLEVNLPPPSSSLLTSLYSVYNADSVGLISLKTSLYAAYNGESNTNDSFGSNNGTAVGGLTYTTGKIGQAFNFNGTNAYVSLPDDSLNFTNQFSYSFWIKSSDTTNYGVVVGNVQSPRSSYSTFHGYEIGMDSGKFFLFFRNGYGNQYIYYTTNIVNNGNWNHIVVTYDPTNTTTGAKIYVNGTLDRQGATLNPIGYSSPMKACIGARNHSGSPVNFLPSGTNLDALNIWSKELTASEVTDLYNSGNGSQYITDSFYKPTTNDALGTNNGTAQGGLTYTPGKIGTAFNFNGTNAYVSLPNNSFNFTGDFSVSGWINQSSVKPYHMIMGNQNSTGISSGYNGWIVWAFNNKLTFDIYNNTTGNASGRWQTTITLPTNTWIHFTVTKKPNQAAKIYLNGSINGGLILGSNTANVSYLPTTYSVIGVNKYSSIDGHWDGSMDALNVWNKELTSTEVTELYNAGNGKQYPY